MDRLPRTCFLNAFRGPIRLGLISIFIGGLSLLAGGCLRSRAPAGDAGLGDVTSTAPQPKSQFRRQIDSLRQAGLDDRSREIESSLGVDDEPMRLFKR